VSYRSVQDLPRAHRWAGLSGIATALVFAAANSLWAFQQPSFGASGQELLDFYGDLSTRIEIGAALALLSVATFVVFASALRSILVQLEGDEILANVAFGGALIGLAAGIGAETINMAAALRAGENELTVPLAQALFDTSYVLGFNAAGVGIGLVALATSAVALRARALMPRWLAFVGIALGATLITPLAVYTLGPAFLFLLALGVLLLRGSAVPR
jgi:hypothetical protein